MSGVASIGRRVKLQLPSATSASVSASISQRCDIAKRITPSSKPGRSVVMRSTGLLDVGLHQVALLDHHRIAGVDPGEDLDLPAITLAEFDRAYFVGVADAD